MWAESGSEWAESGLEGKDREVRERRPRGDRVGVKERNGEDGRECWPGRGEV
jgi:hypothetical protein